MHQPRRTLIVGTAGRDFHVFNTLYRNDPHHRRPRLHRRRHRRRRRPAATRPASPARCTPTASRSCPKRDLEPLIAELGIEDVVFAYSELGNAEVVRLAARVLAAGADFQLVSPVRSMLPTTTPVIAVTAARAGAGKSPTVRYLIELLASWGLRVAVIRHPVRAQSFADDREHAFAIVDGARVDSCAQPTREPHASLPGVWMFSGLDYARDPRRGAGERRRDPVGRGRQRPAVPAADAAHRPHRPAAGRRGGRLLPRRGRPAARRRRDHHQVRVGRDRADRTVRERHHTPSTRERACSPPTPPSSWTAGSASPAGPSSSSRRRTPSASAR